MPKGKSKNINIGLPVTKAGSDIWQKYEGVYEFLFKKSQMTFMGFDYATGHDLALCTFFESRDLDNATDILKQIEYALPNLINVFVRPVIHLKDEEIVLPIDAVRRIDRKSMGHLSTHSEHWKDINKQGELVPKKLLTKIHEDDYGIYENIVFRNLIDRILIFLRQHIYYLSQMLSTLNETVRLEDFSRFNHSGYYLAIGKLYIGFFRNDNSTRIVELLDKTTKLHKLISSYKTRAVYAKNTSSKPLVGGIKKTNILSMHRDYKYVYKLYQVMDSRARELTTKGDEELQKRSQEYYEYFCQALLLFALTNFGLECSPLRVIYKDGLVSADLEFGGWTVTVRAKRIIHTDSVVIRVDTKYKKKSFSLVFVPVSYYTGSGKYAYYERLINNMRLASIDKYVFLEPFDADKSSHYSYSIRAIVEDNGINYAVLPVNISDVNSFRRIQKPVFESMVRSNKGFDVCAFCGDKPKEQTPKNYLCLKCRTAVRDIICKDCGKSFVATMLSTVGLPKTETDTRYIKYMPKFYKSEKEHLFRNITEIRDGNFICPHCDGENKV